MRWMAMIGAASACLMATPVLAQGVSMRPGQRATIAIDSEGAHGSRIDDATLSAFDRFVLTRESPAYAQRHADDPSATLPDEVLAPAIAPGVVAMGLIPMDGAETLLVVENGYDQALTYRATITVNGTLRLASVCLVKPNSRGYELWPHPMDAVSLESFRLLPWKEGDDRPCA